MTNIETIINYIVSLAPTLAAILSMIATVIITIKKIKTNSQDVLESVHRQADSSISLSRQIANLAKENAELKKELTSVIKRINKVKEVEDGKTK
mgnify:CR=1 FL=1